MSRQGKVLMIYTGGTIGMLPEDITNPQSPLAPVDWKRVSGFTPSLEKLPIDIVLHQMPLIDSSNMTPGYWIDIARVIRDHHEQYDGFVILHGTDTMTYTATALSFLLENLGKPVILTGSQIPISEPRNDAAQNLLTAMMLASPEANSLYLVPEVCILFHNVLLRGNRARKVSASAYTGFDSPNYGHLGQIGTHIELNVALVLGQPESNLVCHERLDDRVVMINIFPGMKADILRRIFDTGLKGVVLKTFGAGNAPTDKNFLGAIEYGINERNLVICNVTQCSEGAVEMGHYAASAELLKLGVVSGADMTPEAALVKLQFILGQGLEHQMVKRQMQESIRGELSIS